jgi:hypothetical protein
LREDARLTPRSFGIAVLAAVLAGMALGWWAFGLVSGG